MRHDFVVAMAAVCSALGVAMHATPARACGGCFHGENLNLTPERESVVTDHRMAFSISRAQTILWDQIRYTGDPVEFAWVLPIRPGARVELSNDAFLAALDASTQPVVVPPQITCPPVSYSSYGGSSGSFGGGGGGGGFGCGGTSSASAGFADPSSDFADGGTYTDAGIVPGFQGNDVVTVENQDVIGPYETVTVHATNGQGLEDWLTLNHFAIPPALVPTIQAYTREGFDFLALKLAPGAGVRAMRPVRIVSPGADPTMPLRMVAAGIGANVGITLFVIGEGRYRTQNFPDVTIDPTLLTWTPAQSQSNYKGLVMTALQAGNGNGFLTEYAGHPQLSAGEYVTSAYNPGLYSAYFAQCAAQGTISIPCATDAGIGAGADSGSDPDSGSGSDSGADSGSGSDSGSDSAPTCTVTTNACDTFDDLDVATAGMHPSDVWVTRLRAFLPASAVSSGDLRLEASPLQAAQSSTLSAASFEPPSYNPCPSSQAQPVATDPAPSSESSGCFCTATRDDRGDTGTYALIAFTCFATASIARGARRKRR
jgi:hypothetical protein